MRSGRGLFLFLFSLIIFVIVFADILTGRAISSFINSAITVPAVSFTAKMGTIQKVSKMIIGFRSLAAENEKLRNEIYKLRSDKAMSSNAINENKVLRRALDIPEIKLSKPIFSHVQSFISKPDGYIVLLNSGAQDGVTEEHIVVSPDGVLIGIVHEVFERTVSVKYVADPTFSVAVRIVGTDTVGIAHGNGRGVLNVEFISRDEPVVEEDLVMTSGSDSFPAGIVVGKVLYVEASDAELFKKVNVTAGAGNSYLGEVFLIR